MELSQRLKATINMVDSTESVADIGTDHGYVPICLIKYDRAKQVIAMDLREGPLSRAREHVRLYQMEDRIKLRLSNGLEKISPHEINTLIISGMGGGLMLHILKAYPQVTKTIDTFVLQPQSQVRRVREELLGEGLIISKEDMVFEDGKYYPVIKFTRGDEKSPYKEEELRFGRHLLRDNNQVLYSFLHKEEVGKRRILISLENCQNQERETRKTQVLHEINIIERAKTYYE